MPTLDIDLTFNIIGLTGVGLIIVAFFFLQIGKLTAAHLAYPLLNLIGAILHIISLIRFWNLASLIIEIFWIGISVYGLIRIRNAAS